jgi:L-Ala-D/L-Glu epimerase
MKITKVSAIALTIPMPDFGYTARENAGTKIEWGRDVRKSPHRQNSVLDYIVVKIETDEGLCGWGDVAPDIGFFGETLEQALADINEYMRPKLIGLTPFDREKYLFLVGFRGNCCARSALDLALHDLMGKITGRPVYDLIGGKVREDILVAFEIAGSDPEIMAEVCLNQMEKGVRAFKAKIGGDPEKDVERIKAMRQAVGQDVLIRADANQGFSPKEAIRFCRLCEKHDVGLDLLEQPVAYWDIKGMAEVKNSVDILIEADESAFSIYDAMNLIKQQAVDVINVKIEKMGGLYNAKKVAAMAEAAGIGCVVGTAFGLGATVAAKLHFAASTMIVHDAVEFTELRLHNNFLKEPYQSSLALPLKDGYLKVPNGPGLGIEFDENMFQSYLSPLSISYK